LRSLVAELDGCTGGKAGRIVAAAGLDHRVCDSVTQSEAARLLAMAREAAKPVSADRLGFVGGDPFPGYRYAIERGTAHIVECPLVGGFFKVAHDALGCDSRHVYDSRNVYVFVGLVNTLPAFEPQGEGYRVGEVAPRGPV
jgi:hypothetical protein